MMHETRLSDSSIGNNDQTAIGMDRALRSGPMER